MNLSIADQNTTYYSEYQGLPEESLVLELNNFLIQHKNICFIKIAIKNYAHLALISIKNLILRYKPVILVTFSPHIEASIRQEILKLLWAFGYELREISMESPSHDPKLLSQASNLVCTPKRKEHYLQGEADKHSVQKLGDPFFLYGFLDSKNMPETYLEHIRIWKGYNPTKNIQIFYGHDFERNTAFSTGRYYQEILDLLSLADSRYQGILRCDLARYLYSYENGLSYSDLDVEPKACLDYVWEQFPDKNLLFGVETILSEQQIKKFPAEVNRVQNHGYSMRIGNYLFLCRKRHHPFWLELFQEYKRRIQEIQIYDDDIIHYITGGAILTDIFWKESWKYSDIGFIESQDFNAYFEHKMSGSWRYDS